MITSTLSEMVGNLSSVREKISLFSSASHPVLIVGESGTGKELIAKLLHEYSSRRGPYVVVDCGCVAETLVESELFGSRRGSYTSSIYDNPGLIVCADKGTLFFDEISSMSAIFQSSLLRFLDTMEVKPVGSQKRIAVDTKIIAASNLPISRLSSVVRGDLFYRLSACVIEVPPLRERLEDIPTLSAHFSPSSKFHPSTVDLLKSYHWPGNVRELKFCVQRASLLAGRGKIKPEHVTFYPFMESEDPGEFNISMVGPLPSNGDANPAKDLNFILEEVEKNAIHRALLVSFGNIAEAARTLGLKRTTLSMKIRKHGMRELIKDRIMLNPKLTTDYANYANRH